MAERPGAAQRLLARFEAVLEQMPVGAVLVEAPSGRLVLANRKLEQIWGRSLRRSDRLDLTGALEGYHPGGSRYRPEEWPLARSLATGEAVTDEEIEILRSDGTRGVIRMSCSPVRDEEGGIIGAIATCSDVTEQHRREAGRRFLAEASGLLAASLDYETTLRTVARLAIPTLADQCTIDIRRDDGRIERLAVEHVDPDRLRVAREAALRFPPDPAAAGGVARALRTGRAELIPDATDDVIRSLARGQEHLRLLRQLGIRSVMIVPLVARHRTLGAMVFISTDPARRYGSADLELAEELAVRAALAIDNARLYHESQAANRAKSDFLAVISHELRTPLTAIIGYAELLSLGVPEPITRRQQEHVERIEVSAKHLMQLIEEILTIVRLEGGQLHLHPRDTALADVLDRAEVIIRPLAAAKGLELHLRCDPPELSLVTDPDRLLQVLLNLLSNAVKFTDRGVVALDAELAGSRVRITVRDTGIGLPPEQRDRIFEAFWQAEEPITRRVGGTGVGLTIARRLIDLLGGEIQVDSTEGKGSAFTVWLPREGPRPTAVPG